MPTENRSSNTEQMLSVPRAVLHAAVNGARREHSVAISELRTLLAQSAAQHQGEPTPISGDMHRLMEAYRLGEFKAEGGSDTVEALAVASFDSVESRGQDADSYMAGYSAALYEQAGPFIWLALKPSTHADAGEVERLQSQLIDSRDDLRAAISRNESLMRQLAERDALLNEAARVAMFTLTDDWHARYAALSASAEPSASDCKHPVKCARFNNGEIVDHVCQDCLQVFAPSTPVERDQGIPGTSFQRLNMLANQGELRMEYICTPRNESGLASAHRSLCHTLLGDVPSLAYTPG